MISCLAHALGEQGLTQHLVGLVGAAVQQIFTLEVEAGLGALGQIAGEGERCRATGVLGQERLKLGDEGRIILASTKAFSSWSRAGMRISGTYIPPNSPKNGLSRVIHYSLCLWANAVH